ncbi:MAG: isoprenyl transferase [Bryobacterales bacterium]
MKDFLAWAKPGGRDAEIASGLDPERMPRHIAVIMDGNGRWAKRRFMPRVAGHRAGIDSVREIIESCCRLGIDALTLYAFSVENWKRPRAEVETLWGLLERYLRDELDSLKANNVRFQAIGRVDQLPASVQATLDYAIVETAANSGLRLTVALNYGGRTEIVDAVNTLLAQARQSGAELRVDERTFGDYLYTAGLPDPDLLIRTSGEVRVSNFLLWQIAYTEIWVTEKYWPEFRTEDLLTAIADFQKRERRFGGLSPAKPEPAPALVGARTPSPLGEHSE